jgi:hypothetical protein
MSHSGARYVSTGSRIALSSTDVNIVERIARDAERRRLNIHGADFEHGPIGFAVCFPPDQCTVLD